jgi:hypothetical protein
MTPETHKHKYNQLLACGFASFKSVTDMNLFISKLPESIKERINEKDEHNYHLWIEL